MEALVIELARRGLLGQRQQLGLIECVADDIGGPRHNFQVGVADLSVVDRLLRLWHPIELLADQDPVPGHGVGDIAIEAHPVTCVVVAMLIPELGPGELSRKATCLELEQADQVLGLDQLAGHVVVGA